MDVLVQERVFKVSKLKAVHPDASSAASPDGSHCSSADTQLQNDMVDAMTLMPQTTGSIGQTAEVASPDNESVGDVGGGADEPAEVQQPPPVHPAPLEAVLNDDDEFAPLLFNVQRIVDREVSEAHQQGIQVNRETLRNQCMIRMVRFLQSRIGAGAPIYAAALSTTACTTVVMLGYMHEGHPKDQPVQRRDQNLGFDVAVHQGFLGVLASLLAALVLVLGVCIVLSKTMHTHCQTRHTHCQSQHVRKEKRDEVRPSSSDVLMMMEEGRSSALHPAAPQHQQKEAQPCGFDAGAGQGRVPIYDPSAVAAPWFMRSHGRVQFQISVTGRDDRIITVELKTSDTIDMVRSKIRAQLGIEDQHGLIFTGIRLAPDRALHWSVDMSSNFRITLKELDGTSRTAEMESSNTIYDVMSKIPDPLGIPADQQRLIFSFLRVKTSKFKSKKSKPRVVLARFLRSRPRVVLARFLRSSLFLRASSSTQRLIFSFLRVKTSKFKSKKSKPRKNNAAGGAAQKKQRLRDAER
jgi:hypothetical protein